VLVAAALAVTAPFFTSRIIGGVDARWYAWMLADYIEQVRRGRLLVTVGQGAFAWNGSVHLFRSAPVYMAVARAWDLLTFQRLNPFALQHLTAITSAVAGTLGFYAAAVKLIPDRRWTAAGLALLYLGTPSWLATAQCSEAYMSYMAFAAMPLVLYGNARTALRDDGRGYIILGSGLALIWMCHPPLAFGATMVTVVIQSGLMAGRGVVSWRNMAAGAATFAVLGAYYFASMSELPPQPLSDSNARELAQIAGFALFFAGIGRLALVPRAPGWALCAAAGALVLWRTDHPWLCWAAGTAAVWLVCVLAFRGSGLIDFRRHAFALLFLSALAGAAIAEAWVGREGMFLSAVHTLAENTANIGELFAPLHTPLRRIQLFQPGWGLIAVFLVIVSSLFGSGPLGAKVFYAVSLGVVVSYVRVPLVSNFLVGRFPIDLAAMTGVPMGLRTAPVIASCIAFSGVVWFSTLKAKRPDARAALGCILGVAVLWCAYEDVTFVQHSYAVTGTEAASERNLRPENAMLDAYAYLLLPIPDYFSHGKTDPAIENRILDESGRVLVGPDQDAAAMERRGFRMVRLVTRPIPNSTNWYAVTPSITVEPGEHLLLRFDFDPSRNYAGYFILEAEHSYREYHLPDSGEPAAFGAGPSMGRVLSLWNTGTTAEHYQLSLSGEPGNDVPHDGGLFANLYLSKLDTSALQIRLTSLMPYRATVTSPAGGVLETLRVFIPGYRARVDGHEVPVFASKQHLVSMRLAPGAHEVELSFVGTARLWLAAAVSGAGWLCLMAAAALAALRNSRGSAS